MDETAHSTCGWFSQDEMDGDERQGWIVCDVRLSYRHKAELRVGGMRMLRFSPGVTRGDRSRNGQNRGTLRVERDGDKMEWCWIYGSQDVGDGAAIEERVMENQEIIYGCSERGKKGYWCRGREDRVRQMMLWWSPEEEVERRRGRLYFYQK